ncbi:MAG TPA: hypothetical protein VFG83_12910 [Kofleriaceae bacterium]|nr:hypothetical protein [Kofleriaceae bacterium]
MESLKSGDLAIVVEAQGASAIVCDWRGKSNNRHPEQVLGSFFSNLLRSAATTKSDLEMHFESLEHFNSSTITVLIQFIQDARSATVPLTFVYDEGLKWQKLSFEALRAFERSDSMFHLRATGE